MKDPYTVGMEPVKEKHVWKSGSSWVVPIPNDWVNRHRKSHEKSLPVNVAQTDDNTMVISVKDPLAEKIEKYESQVPESPLRMESKVFGAYMRGDPKIELHIPKGHLGTRTAFFLIPSKLFGVEPPDQIDDSGENFVLNFSDKEDIKIQDGLMDATKRIELMYQSNSYALEKFPDKRTIDANKVLTDQYENWTDQFSFYMKRLLNRSILDRILFAKMEIGDRRNILYYDTIVNNVERIGDLHREISMTVDRLSLSLKSSDKLSLAPLCEYLRVSHSMVEKALNIMTGRRNGAIPDWQRTIDNVIGYEYIDGVYTKKQVEELAKYVDSNHPYTRYLSMLQSRIWGLTGNASNIIEAKLNMF